jgi:hypothetical protein
MEEPATSDEKMFNGNREISGMNFEDREIVKYEQK